MKNIFQQGGDFLVAEFPEDSLFNEFVCIEVCNDLFACFFNYLDVVEEVLCASAGLAVIGADDSLDDFDAIGDVGGGDKLVDVHFLCQVVWWHG